ncbi:unnamed protein product [Effrenium voratum]|uniref:Uncharacterized protein n=1 Tax=Effrenium voratum TaxID=2562239 RepID=A0AA36MMU7_9DINO|nr:unnamed protein product [Effrenium voratum]
MWQLQLPASRLSSKRSRRRLEMLEYTSQVLVCTGPRFTMRTWTCWWSDSAQAALSASSDRNLRPKDRSRLLGARAAVQLRRHMEGDAATRSWNCPEAVLDTRRPGR